MNNTDENIQTQCFYDEKSFNSYCPGHPWYYHLLGYPPYIKNILHEVKRKGYLGYLQEDIEKADRHAERKIRLENLFVKCKLRFKENVSIYRKYRLSLIIKRNKKQEVDLDLCQSLSLKHNHIYNDLGHLVYIDSLLKKAGSQMDLFGF